MLDIRTGGGRILPKPELRKLSLYESLFHFNQYCEDAKRCMEIFRQANVVERTELDYFTAMLDELRSAVSQSIVEHLGTIEIESTAKHERRRLSLEKKLLRQ